MTFREAVDGVDAVGPALEGSLKERAYLMKPGENMPNVLERLGQGRKSFATWRLAWNRPVPTVLKLASPSFGGQVHPDLQCLVSIEAVKRCASFPDGFRMMGAFEDAWAAVGNCVPPMLMAAVAGAVRG